MDNGSYHVYLVVHHLDDRLHQSQEFLLEDDTKEFPDIIQFRKSIEPAELFFLYFFLQSTFFIGTPTYLEVNGLVITTRIPILREGKNEHLQILLLVNQEENIHLRSRPILLNLVHSLLCKFL